VVDTEKVATEGLEVAGEALSAIAKVASIAGTIAEVVGNAIQVGLGVAQYASLAAYQSDFQAAMSTASQPVTLSDLKQMDSGTQANGPNLMTYLNAMMAAGGSVPSVNK
jgi:hypothetical protein